MATVVSCYYIVPSKHAHANYERWIELFMSLPMQTVLFVDHQSHGKLLEKYPETDRRKYIRKEIQEFETSKWSWEQDLTMDEENHKGHSIPLYKIWTEKPFFVEHAAKLNLYNSSHFVWCDIGCFRSADHMARFSTFPSVSKLHPSKIEFLNIEPFTYAEYETTRMVDHRFRTVDRIGGTMFSCPAHLVDCFANIHRSMLTQFDSNRVCK